MSEREKVVEVSRLFELQLKLWSLTNIFSNKFNAIEVEFSAFRVSSFHHSSFKCAFHSTAGFYSNCLSFPIFNTVFKRSPLRAISSGNLWLCWNCLCFTFAKCSVKRQKRERKWWKASFFCCTFSKTFSSLLLVTLSHRTKQKKKVFHSS